MNSGAGRKPISLSTLSTHSAWLIVAMMTLSASALGLVRPDVAFAQGQLPGPHVSSAVLTGIIPSEISTTEARLVLTFNQPVTKSSILTNDGDVNLIAVMDASLLPGAPSPTSKYGPLQAMGFAQNGNLLTLTLTGAVPIHTEIVPLGPKALAVTIKTVKALATTISEATDHPVHPGDSEAPGDVFEVLPLKYADVSEIVGLLTASQVTKPNDNFNPQEPAFGSAGVNNSSGGISSPTFNLGGANNMSTDSIGSSIDETVGIDRRLNAIILKGPVARVNELKARIAKLDVAVTSVILETVFVELTESGAHNVGLDFNNSNGQLATVTYQYAKGGLSSATGTAIPDTTQRWGSATLSLQAVLSAQVQAGEGRIISKPRIAAQSGSTAKIITGDALPILTSIALSGVNAVQQEVQYVNVGVTLQIAPRVSDDGFVTSHVFAEVSSVTGVSQGYPTISQREASTMATVKDGESFIIGGLTQDNSLSTRNEVPLLGGVPVLGSFFKNLNSSKTKTNLYIIVTPHIIRGHDDSATALAKSE